MTIFLGILLTLVIFTAIVFIHELGHFLAARMTGMKVEEFGIGLPPKAKVIARDKKGTIYTLNWLPIGGFVRIKGEDPGGHEAKSKDAFSAKKWWARSLVLVAGVTMNFVLAVFIITGLFLSGVSPIFPNVFSSTDYGSFFFPTEEKAIETGYIKHSGVEVQEVLSGGVAAISGILPGDILLKNNGEEIKTTQGFIDIIKKGGVLNLTILSNDTLKTITLVPANGQIKAVLAYKNGDINTKYSVKYNFKEAVITSIHETYKLSLFTFDILGSTLRKLIAPKNQQERNEAKESLSGPIGMGVAFTSMVEQGVSLKLIFIFIALLSINLGVLNILPFPALDGGRIVSTTARSIIGLFYHKTTMLDTIEYFIHAFGMVLLLALSLLVALLDITRFF